MAEISAKQQKIIEILLTGTTVGESAKLAGIGERTLTRWLSEDLDFREALRQAQSAAFDGMVTRLSAMGENAVTALCDGLGADAPVGLRVRTGFGVIDRLLAIRESQQLELMEERLSRLESGSQDNGDE